MSKKKKVCCDCCESEIESHDPSVFDGWRGHNALTLSVYSPEDVNPYAAKGNRLYFDFCSYTCLIEFAKTERLNKGEIKCGLTAKS